MKEGSAEMLSSISEFQFEENGGRSRLLRSPLAAEEAALISSNIPSDRRRQTWVNEDFMT